MFNDQFANFVERAINLAAALFVLAVGDTLLSFLFVLHSPVAWCPDPVSLPRYYYLNNGSWPIYPRS